MRAGSWDGTCTLTEACFCFWNVLGKWSPPNALLEGSPRHCGCGPPSLPAEVAVVDPLCCKLYKLKVIEAWTEVLSGSVAVCGTGCAPPPQWWTVQGPLGASSVPVLRCTTQGAP
jgi:hypothetical protein